MRWFAYMERWEGEPERRSSTRPRAIVARGEGDRIAPTVFTSSSGDVGTFWTPLAAEPAVENGRVTAFCITRSPVKPGGAVRFLAAP